MTLHPNIKGGVAISGIFDLEPISLSHLNENLHLTEREIATLSPVRLNKKPAAPLDLFLGTAELAAFRWQSTSFAQEAGSRDQPVTMMKELPGHTHFTILDELSNPNGAIALHIRNLVFQS